MNAYNYCILLVVGRMEEVKGVVAGHKIVNRSLGGAVAERDDVALYQYY